MHPNPVFHDATSEKNLEFALERGFGTLAINGDDGPLMSHVPFILSEDRNFIEMHLLRSNPIARALATQQKAIISITGPDGYISPDWYEAENLVPTWNYVSVHLRGSLEQMADSTLKSVLDRLSAANEAKLLPKTPWKSDKVEPEALTRMLRMLVPCRMSVTDIDGTWKLGQNKPTDARRNAAKMARSHDIGQETNLLAALMLGVSE